MRYSTPSTWSAWWRLQILLLLWWSLFLCTWYILCPHVCVYFSHLLFSGGSGWSWWGQWSVVFVCWRNMEAERIRIQYSRDSPPRQCAFRGQTKRSGWRGGWSLFWCRSCIIKNAPSSIYIMQNRLKSSRCEGLFDYKKARGRLYRQTRITSQKACGRPDGRTERTDILYYHSRGLELWPASACAARNYDLCEWTFIADLKPFFKQKPRYNLYLKNTSLFYHGLL